jgi:23S rRNA pseudouridine1911/1915/1917 synthase
MNPEFKKHVFEVSHSGRLDKVISDSLSDVSRGKVQAAILAGKVKLNGEVCLKASTKSETGDKVELLLEIDREDTLLAEDIPLNTIYVDENVIVINKPAGMVVHPGAGNQRGTLVNALLYHWPDIREVGEAGRPGIVHRLDKDTSGVLIVARNNEAYKWLVKQFKTRKVIKKYLALVDGHPPTPSGRIEANIGRDDVHRQRMTVKYGKSRAAVSEYQTVQSYARHALLEVQPFTGRTHQIRVHMAFINTPITGDKVYGRRKLSVPVERFFLHANKLGIILPGDKEPTEFVAPLPEDLKEIIKIVEKLGK